MKIHHLILIVLCNISFIGWSQTQEHHVISLPEMNVLYRGYDNKIEYSTSSKYDTVVLLIDKETGIEIKWIEKNRSVLKIDTNCPSRSIEVSSYGIKNNDTTKFSSLAFRIQNPPEPYIYWGGFRLDEVNNEPDSIFYLRGSRLFAKYGPETPLTASFSINQATLIIGNDSYINYGSAIREQILRKLHEAPKGTIIRIENVIVNGPIEKYDINPPFYHIKTSNE